MNVFETYPIVGQQAIVGAGTYRAFLGLVVSYNDSFPYQHIRVRHPITGVECDYDPQNVELIDPRKGTDAQTEKTRK